MRRSLDFDRAVRHGVRCGGKSLVLHLVRDQTDPATAVVGFVVSKAVGNAVVRNRVKRRLRAVVSERIGQLPQGGRLVVRALPESARRDFDQLGADFDAALAGARRKASRPRAR